MYVANRKIYSLSLNDNYKKKVVLVIDYLLFWTLKHQLPF